MLLRGFPRPENLQRSGKKFKLAFFWKKEENWKRFPWEKKKPSSGQEGKKGKKDRSGGL
jgi:hypothetical protein